MLVGIALCAAVCGCGRGSEPHDGKDARAAHPESSPAPPPPTPGAPNGGGESGTPSPGSSVALPETSRARPASSAGSVPLAYLKRFVGQTPIDVDLWRTQPLAPLLAQVLGIRYTTLLINMQEAIPIRAEGDLVYVSGHKKYATDAAALVVDTRASALYVWLCVDGKPEEFRWGDSAIVLPAAIRQVVERGPATP